MVTVAQQCRRWYSRTRQISPCRIPGLTRLQLVTYFDGWGLKKGAEIGVARGSFSRAMFERNPGLELIGVDPWVRLPHLNEEGIAHHKLRTFPWTPIKDTSERAAALVEDGSLDFVYIDGNHEFDFVMLDLILWSRKVRSGGLVAGHDYYRFRNAGVVPAVDVYTREHGITEWFVTDEKEASFFWAKP